MILPLGLLLLSSVFPSSFAYVSSNATFWSSFTPRSDILAWSQCEGLDERYSCALFKIPLDWHDSTAGDGQVAVMKYSALQDRVGTIFSNPGGPGASGLNHIEDFGELMSELSGEIYDIISWDPRGVGSISYPSEVICFDSVEEYSAYWNNSVVTDFEVRGNFTEKDDIDWFYSQMDDYEHRMSGLAEQCLSVSTGQNLQYVGTTATVRDMVALADVTDGPNEHINFWGMSYGTAIGNFFVNMFPERVGRVILDGVVSPIPQAVGRADFAWQGFAESADEAFQGFAIGCAKAGPSGCKLADPEVNGGKDVMTWAQDLIDLAYDLTVAGYLATGWSISMRNSLHQAMYSPQGWAYFANEEIYGAWDMISGVAVDARNKIKKRELEPILRRDHIFQRRSDSGIPSDTMTAINCGDSVDPGLTTTKEVFDEYLRVSHEVSGTFGPSYFPHPAHQCHLWPVRAVERFQGPFNSSLAQPILVIGNTADPATPFKNAEEVADYLGDSAILVEQLGFGHCTVAQKSKCIQKILVDYFVHGKHPEGDDTVCPVDDTDQLFPVKGITAASISAAIVESKDTSDRVEQLEKEKKTLFVATIALAAASALLIVILVVQFILGRRNQKKYVQVSQFQSWNSAEKPYDDPYVRR